MQIVASIMKHETQVVSCFQWCIASKVLERLIYNHLTDFLIDSFSNQQFGFLAGSSQSALQQLLLFTNDILEAKTNPLRLTTQIQMSQLYFDYSKAFDSVPHRQRIAVQAMEYGVTGDLWSWFKYYLSY